MPLRKREPRFVFVCERENKTLRLVDALRENVFLAAAFCCAFTYVDGDDGDELNVILSLALPFAFCRACAFYAHSFSDAAA